MYQVLQSVINIIVILYVFITSYYLGINKHKCNIFNPLYNYKNWKSLNWFGVIVCTLFINIIFLPYAVFIWLYKLIHRLFTMGRK